jgi:hypothetical protein
MATLTKNEELVLRALRTEAESDDGNGYWTVYLDNARPAGMSVHGFAATLGSLKNKGLYREVDGYAWGQVKMQEEAA